MSFPSLLCCCCWVCARWQRFPVSEIDAIVTLTRQSPEFNSLLFAVLEVTAATKEIDFPRYGNDLFDQQWVYVIPRGRGVDL